MRCQELVDAVRDHIDLRAGDPSSVIHDITTDSRAVKKGSLFVALEGANFDGHRFVDAAIELGASACLVRTGFHVDGDVVVLEAEDPRAALGPVASKFFGHPMKDLLVVGITGTNGKTTCAYLLEQIFRADQRSVGVIGTTGYRWASKELPAINTTPESLDQQRIARQMVDDGVEVLVMEVSSHGLATHRMDSTLVDLGIFTNLSQDHLDFHQTMQAYRDAKRRLFLEVLPRSKRAGKLGLAVFNVDDDEGAEAAELARAAGLDVYTVSRDSEPVADVKFGLGALSVELDWGETISIRTGLMGEFNLENVLVVARAALAVGASVESIESGLAGVNGVRGRLEVVHRDPWVLVDYAHTPDALERALEALAPFVEGKLWVVFGCGGDRDREKRPLMARVAESRADRVILTSDNPRFEEPEAIIEDIARGFEVLHESGEAAADSFCVEVDRARAIRLAVTTARDEDVVLIAGKGHEDYQDVSGSRREFDDVAHARRAAGLRE